MRFDSDTIKLKTKGGKYEVETKYEYPQAENFDEAVQIFSGQDNVLAALNGILKQRSPATVRTQAKGYEATSQEAANQFVSERIANTRNYRPDIGGLSKAATLDAVEAVRAQGAEALKNMSADELRAQLAKITGITVS